jgi:hypothetical protein
LFASCKACTKEIEIKEYNIYINSAYNAYKEREKYFQKNKRAADAAGVLDISKAGALLLARRSPETTPSGGGGWMIFWNVASICRFFYKTT